MDYHILDIEENECLSKGMEIVKQAVIHDNHNELETALSLYKQALEYAEYGLKYEKNERRKVAIRDKMVQYKNRAEQIKEFLEKKDKSKKKTVSVCGSSNDERKKGEDGKSDDEENVDPETAKLQNVLSGSVVKENSNVKCDDKVAELEQAKSPLKEAVILHVKFPQLFTGNRTSWKGVCVVVFGSLLILIFLLSRLSPSTFEKLHKSSIHLHLQLFDSCIVIGIIIAILNSCCWLMFKQTHPSIMSPSNGENQRNQRFHHLSANLQTENDQLKRQHQTYKQQLDRKTEDWINASLQVSQLQKLHDTADAHSGKLFDCIGLGWNKYFADNEMHGVSRRILQQPSKCSKAHYYTLEISSKNSITYRLPKEYQGQKEPSVHTGQLHYNHRQSQFTLNKKGENVGMKISSPFAHTKVHFHNDKDTLQNEQVQCLSDREYTVEKFGSVIVENFWNRTSLQFDPVFESDLDKLYVAYTNRNIQSIEWIKQIKKFFDLYGTHVIVGVELGTMSETSKLDQINDQESNKTNENSFGGSLGTGADSSTVNSVTTIVPFAAKFMASYSTNSTVDHNALSEITNQVNQSSGSSTVPTVIHEIHYPLYACLPYHTTTWSNRSEVLTEAFHQYRSLHTQPIVRPNTFHFCSARMKLQHQRSILFDAALTTLCDQLKSLFDCKPLQFSFPSSSSIVSQYLKQYIVSLPDLDDKDYEWHARLTDNYYTTKTPAAILQLRTEPPIYLILDRIKDSSKLRS